MAFDYTILIGSALALMLLSYLWRANIMMELAEGTFVAVNVAHAVVVGVYFIWRKGFLELFGGKTIYIFPIILGFLLLTRFSKQYAWLSTIPLSIIIGGGIGLTMRGFLHSYVIRSISAVVNYKVSGISEVIFLISFFTATTYFIFGQKITGHPIMSKGVNRLGRLVLMCAFGVGFGNVVWTRLSYLIGGLNTYILADPGYYMIPVIGLFVIIGIILDSRSKKY